MGRFLHSLTESDNRALRDVAHLLAAAARAAILPHFRNGGLVADNKEAGGFDPVTAADREAEAAMRDILARERPDDGILGEEFGAEPGTSGLTWVLDPIDGTRAFVCGAPTFGVLISVRDEAGPIFGIIHQPFTNEVFEGGFGVARSTGPLGHSPLKARSGRRLSDATVLTTFPEVGSEAEGKAFHAVARQARLTRYGLDCYGYALLAAGTVDLVIEAGLAPYDICAPIAVIEAAGGVVTNWDGGPAHEGGRALAAGSSEIHAEALAILRQSLAGP